MQKTMKLMLLILSLSGCATVKYSYNGENCEVINRTGHGEVILKCVNLVTVRPDGGK